MSKGLTLNEHLHLMIWAEPHRICAEHAAPLARRAKIAPMSAATRAHHVGADASRKAQHKIVSSAARRGCRRMCEPHKRQRTSHPRPSDPHDFPIISRVAAITANFIGENRDLMTCRAQALSRHYQIALGTASSRIEPARKQPYPHRNAP